MRSLRGNGALEGVDREGWASKAEPSYEPGPYESAHHEQFDGPTVIWLDNGVELVLLCFWAADTGGGTRSLTILHEMRDFLGALGHEV